MTPTSLSSLSSSTSPAASTATTKVFASNASQEMPFVERCFRERLARQAVKPLLPQQLKVVSSALSASASSASSTGVSSVSSPSARLSGSLMKIDTPLASPSSAVTSSSMSPSRSARSATTSIPRLNVLEDPLESLNLVCQAIFTSTLTVGDKESCIQKLSDLMTGIATLKESTKLLVNKNCAMLVSYLKANTNKFLDIKIKTISTNPSTLDAKKIKSLAEMSIADSTCLTFKQTSLALFILQQDILSSIHKIRASIDPSTSSEVQKNSIIERADSTITLLKNQMTKIEPLLKELSSATIDNFLKSSQVSIAVELTTKSSTIIPFRDYLAKDPTLGTDLVNLRTTSESPYSVFVTDFSRSGFSVLKHGYYQENYSPTSTTGGSALGDFNTALEIEIEKAVKAAANHFRNAREGRMKELPTFLRQQIERIFHQGMNTPILEELLKKVDTQKYKISSYSSGINSDRVQHIPQESYSLEEKALLGKGAVVSVNGSIITLNYATMVAFLPLNEDGEPFGTYVGYAGGRCVIEIDVSKMDPDLLLTEDCVTIKVVTTPVALQAMDIRF